MLELLPAQIYQTHTRNNAPKLIINQFDLGAKPKTLEVIRLNLLARTDQTFNAYEVCNWMNTTTKLESGRIIRRITRLCRGGYLTKLSLNQFTYREKEHRGRYRYVLSKRSQDIIAEFGCFTKIDAPTMYFARQHLPTSNTLH